MTAEKKEASLRGDPRLWIARQFMRLEALVASLVLLQESPPLSARS